VRLQNSLFPILGLVLAITFLAYLPSLKNQFVNWDDEVHLLENRSLQILDSEHLKRIFQEKVNKIYIPLTTLSFAFEYKFFGTNPFFYHLDNVLLHLGVVALIFFFGRALGLSAKAAGLGALLFGVHPMHVESVAWVTERKDVLYAFLYLAALLCYWRYLIQSQKFYYGLSVVFSVLSMLAKPMALSLPLIFLLCDWFKGRPLTRKFFLEKIPFAAFLGALAWITYQEHVRLPLSGLGEGILVWIWTLTFYIRQFIFPGVLLPIYHLPRPVGLVNSEYLLALTFLGFLIWATVRLWKDKWFRLAVLFYFLSIFFLLRFDDAADINVVADRFMYLPSLGFALWGGRQGQGIWEGTLKRIPLVKPLAIFGCLFLVWNLSLRTFMQCQIWKNSFTLWQYQLLFHPNEPTALNNLATVYRDQPPFKKAEEQYRTILKLQKEGLSEEAIKAREKVVNQFEFLVTLYKKAIAGNPEYVDAYYNLAKLYQDVERPQEAVALYHQALQLNPGYKDAYFNLGRLYQQLGEEQKAVEAYNQMIQTNPRDADLYINAIKAYTEAIKANPTPSLYIEACREALDRYRSLGDVDRRHKDSEVFYFNLGYLYQEMGDNREAVAAYELALELNPNYVNALYNLGNIYEEGGENKKALFLYGKVIALNPKHPEAYLNSGLIYGRLGDYPKAIEFYHKAIEANPKLAHAYFNLGYVYEIKNEPDKAIENYERAVQADSRHAEAYYNMGNVYARMRQNDQAISFYLRAVEINPNHMDAWVNLSILSFRQKDYAAAIKYFDEARLLGYDPPLEYSRVLEKYRR